ncbi:hypothetical protein D6783_06125 [Candidatus Woesearchaeota archaeon]|nr:MAG: hypothetical protein D6783_06125 [Candidatus Woesearchaeota archaeon]
MPRRLVHGVFRKPPRYFFYALSPRRRPGRCRGGGVGLQKFDAMNVTMNTADADCWTFTFSEIVALLDSVTVDLTHIQLKLTEKDLSSATRENLVRKSQRLVTLRDKLLSIVANSFPTATFALYGETHAGARQKR